MALEDNFDFSNVIPGITTASSTSSVKRPLDNDDLTEHIRKSIVENVSTFGKQYSEGSGVDSTLINNIIKRYSNALTSVGLNFDDPLKTYSTNFNRNMQTLGLDPQKPGNSYVFFTRPDLNLSASTVNRMAFLKYSMQSEVGQLVVDLLQYPTRDKTMDYDPSTDGGDAKKLDSSFSTDSFFDPLKSNLCKELTGLKDFTLDKYETEGDFMGRQLTYASGADGYDSIGEVTVTFEDAYRSPMFLSHYLHLQYIQEVCRGTISPRLRYIQERCIDYTISMYVFKLAEDNKTILRFAKLTGCFPISVPMNTLNHSRENKLDEFDEVSISYAYNSYEPMNPKIIADFNWLAMQTAFTNYGATTLANKTKGTPAGGFNAVMPLEENNIGILIDRFNLQFPRKFDDSMDYERELENATIWARTPFINGNKLLFI